ncbi:CDH-8 protein, partial [Aphelenchoides avenae]
DWTEFTIDQSGNLRPKRTFDYERKSHYDLKIQVCDFFDRCSTSAFRVQVVDVDDNCPMFIPSKEVEVFSVRENLPVDGGGVSLGKFEAAIDADGTAESRSICYYLLDGQSTFAIHDARVPELFVHKSLDREVMPQYNVSIAAKDCHRRETEFKCPSSADDEKASRKTVKILVEDVNDNFPRFSQRTFRSKVMERQTEFGQSILKLEARDPDVEDRGLRYRLSSDIRTDLDIIPKDESPFAVNLFNGAVTAHVAFGPNSPLTYSFRVTVRDGVGHEDECTVIVVTHEQQVEFTFGISETLIQASKQDIERLLSELLSLVAVIDDIIGRSPTTTTVIAHFLDRANMAVQAEDVIRLYRNADARAARDELRTRFGHSSARSVVHGHASEQHHQSSFGSVVDFTNEISEKLHVHERHHYLIALAFALFILPLLVVTTRIWCCKKSSFETAKFRAPSRWENTVDLYRGRSAQIRHIVYGRGYATNYAHSRLDGSGNPSANEGNATTSKQAARLFKAPHESTEF